MPEPVHLSEEVADALRENRPVVALESTIITHGMPWPSNVETARSVGAAVRGEGAVPATVAVVEGRLRVGLDDAALEVLGHGEGVVKAASRDLPVAMARGLSAGTTVSATMRAAHGAGVKVFATGGIGGVHREHGETLDVSADLTELSRTPVAVVSAGVKSILDIPRTLEMLETLGVPVLTYRCDAFPAFYTRDSGSSSPWRVDEAEEAARIVAAHRLLGGGGVLIANPVPEAHALDPETIGAAIDAALEDASRKGIAGKDVTPHLLAHLNGGTGGTALAANIALVLHNARLAARIAKELATARL